MDIFGSLLDGPRARGAFMLKAVLDPPWGLRVQDRAPLSLFALVQGEAWVLPEHGEPVRMAPGDVALAVGPDPYVVADKPATRPQVVIHPGQRCTTLDGEELAEKMSLGVRTWGNSMEGEVVMLVGAYERPSEISRRLLGALPPLVVIPADDWDTPLIPLLGAEIDKPDAGQEVVLDRLLDLLVVSAVRAWFARPGAEPPAWYRAQGDDVVGRALRLIHHNPEHPWTVAALAGEAGVSRAALARRFADLVGEPPMAYLMGWRLALAADLLREPDATIASVARRVGYGSAFALSTAFKRERGLSPQEHRQALAAAVPAG